MEKHQTIGSVRHRFTRFCGLLLTVSMILGSACLAYAAPDEITNGSEDLVNEGEFYSFNEEGRAASENGLSVSGNEPTTSEDQPTISGDQPTVSGDQPTVSGDQPLENKYTSVDAPYELRIGRSITQKVTGAYTAVTYTSSDPKVVKVGKTTGKITAVSYGTAVITSKAAASTEYKVASQDLTVKVIPRNTQMVYCRSLVKGKILIISNTNAKGCDGYRIKYKHNGVTKKIDVNAKSTGAAVKTITNLVSGKQFKVKIRAFGVGADGKTYFGKFCNWKTRIIK